MDFITLEMFYTLAGCVAIVMLLTQALKYVPKLKDINPLYNNFFVSLIVGIIRIFVLADYSWQRIILGILNIFVIMFAAAGGYDTVKTVASSIRGDKEE